MLGHEPRRARTGSSRSDRADLVLMVRRAKSRTRRWLASGGTSALFFFVSGPCIHIYRIRTRRCGVQARGDAQDEGLWREHVSGEREAISAQVLFGGSSLPCEVSVSTIQSLTAQARSLPRANPPKGARRAHATSLHPEHPHAPPPHPGPAPFASKWGVSPFNSWRRSSGRFFSRVRRVARRRPSGLRRGMPSRRISFRAPSPRACAVPRS